MCPAPLLEAARRALLIETNLAVWCQNVPGFRAVSVSAWVGPKGFPCCLFAREQIRRRNSWFSRYTVRCLRLWVHFWRGAEISQFRQNTTLLRKKEGYRSSIPMWASHPASMPCSEKVRPRVLSEMRSQGLQLRVHEGLEVEAAAVYPRAMTSNMKP